jgi:DNA polymerase III delta prime subunit
LREILDDFGLAGTDFVNQLHGELHAMEFLTGPTRLDLTELMAEIDFRLVEGGGEMLQLDAMTARICSSIGA